MKRAMRCEPGMNRILVVDDEERNIEIINRIFVRDDYEMEFAQNGKDALECVSDFEPDVIVLDVMMPGIDGYKVCHQLKSDKETSKIMVLLLSGKVTIEDRLKGYEVQADDYVTKPYDPEELRAKVRILLRLKNAQDERDRFIHKLEGALAKVKTLSGLLPICSSCKKIRDDKGYWNQIETYIREHSEAQFSHGICPECAKMLYPEIYAVKK